MNYQEIAISCKNRSYEENLNLIIARKAECNHIIELREKHISWLQENPISLEKVNLLKKEEWALGYNFYGYGMNFSKLLDALNYWEDFYTPYDEIDDLERFEKSLKFDNANEFIVKVIENKPVMPSWKKKLIDNGLVDTDGKTVLASNLETVTNAIRDYTNLVITRGHLKDFIKFSDGKPYSPSAIKKALIVTNTTTCNGHF